MCLPCIESVKPVFIATYKHPLSFITWDFKASLRPRQSEKRLHQPLCTTNLYKDCKLISRSDSALNVSPDAMSIVGAEPVEVQDWRSHKSCTLSKRPRFDMRVYGVAEEDDV